MVCSLFHQTLRSSRRGLSTPERCRQSARDWMRLIELIEQGEANSAEKLGQTLIIRSRDMAISLLRSEVAARGA